MKKYIFKFLTFVFLLISLVHISSNLGFAEENNKFECEVNCCFSIGQTCRPAYHIQRHGKRFQASPLDWMRDCSLDTCIHLFKTKFSDFFQEIKEFEPWPGEYRGRHVKDIRHGITSIHHFLFENPLNHEEHQKFRKMMLNRANKVDNILNQSESIALVYSQECKNSFMPSNEKLIEFLKSFSEIYPNKNIYLIVVRYAYVEGVQKEITFEEDNLKIIEFTFLDNGQDWTGNHNSWDEVMNCIKVTKI